MLLVSNLWYDCYPGIIYFEVIRTWYTAATQTASRPEEHSIPVRMIVDRRTNGLQEGQTLLYLVGTWYEYEYGNSYIKEHTFFSEPQSTYEVQGAAKMQRLSWADAGGPARGWAGSARHTKF